LDDDLERDADIQLTKGATAAVLVLLLLLSVAGCLCGVAGSWLFWA